MFFVKPIFNIFLKKVSRARPAAVRLSANPFPDIVLVQGYSGPLFRFGKKIPKNSIYRLDIPEKDAIVLFGDSNNSVFVRFPYR